MKLLLYPVIEKSNKLVVYRSNDAAIGKYILKNIHFVTLHFLAKKNFSSYFAQVTVVFRRRHKTKTE